MNNGESHISVTISNGPLAAAGAIESQPGGGAAVCFEGIVRRLENDQPIEGLFYQAYQPMAERQIRRIAGELVAAGGLLRFSVEHSVGWVAVGRCSFRLFVVAPHRKEAFVAMQEFIDRLKRDVPIWKSVRQPASASEPIPAKNLSSHQERVQGVASTALSAGRVQGSGGDRILPRRFDVTSDSPIDIVSRLAEQCAVVGAEQIDISQAGGRILAERILADRDHPACDVSAIDGYAIRLSQLSRRHLPTAFELRIGEPAPSIPESGVVKIVTGAPVPAGADALIRRELVEEFPDHIVIPESLNVKPGQDIRRMGDNIRAGEIVLDAGSAISPAAMSALASFGVCRPSMHAKVRIGVIIGGDELIDVRQTPQPWEIRESNGHALQAFLQPIPWVELVGVKRVRDDLATVVAALEESLQSCHAVLLSGGVSMGDRDFVPAAVQAVGGRVIFHGLPMRPGRPTLGAVGPGGQAILGLPGNPLSVMTAARRFGMIVLRKIAGASPLDPPVPTVRLETPINADPRFWLFRPVRLTADGVAAPLSVKSSGDLAGAARSDGFVQIPPGSTAAIAPFFRWSLT